MFLSNVVYKNIERDFRDVEALRVLNAQRKVYISMSRGRPQNDYKHKQ